jgi:threonine aldolase
MPDIVDIRSDTVTRPTPGMRRAMAEAVVGDDVFGDDPTLKELEARVARLTGKEAALYVVSGTMGNQLAVKSQTQPGGEVLLESDCHIFAYEAAGVAALSGCQTRILRGARGVIAPVDVTASLRDDNDHVPPVQLLCLENTHNRHGGAVVPLDKLRAPAAAAHAHGLKVHLDGARLWNASAATGIPVHEWAAAADTVMMCFSKGLGAPVGSILAGSEATIRAARRHRKRWGGGIRQGGVLAAACLYALDHHVDRLKDDHRRAQRLASGLTGFPGVRVKPEEVETNIVLVEIEDPELTVPALLEALERRGVKMVAFGPRRIRAVTHLDVDDAGIERAIAAFGESIGELLGRAAAR